MNAITIPGPDIERVFVGLPHRLPCLRTTGRPRPDQRYCHGFKWRGDFRSPRDNQECPYRANRRGRYELEGGLHGSVPGDWSIHRLCRARGVPNRDPGQSDIDGGPDYGCKLHPQAGRVFINVEVQASATQIDTTSGAISQVIDQKTITELPLNGRNPAALVALAPGAVDASQTGGTALPGVGSGSPNETAAVVNGSRIGGVLYQLDGITHMNNYFQTASPFPNPDATQEFRVITNNFDAQYGYTAGGVVSIATRSGTNQWHGIAFEFLRNNVLNAADYFTKVANPLKRNQFGGSVGGPILHNKLFVFGNVQFTRERILPAPVATRYPIITNSRGTSRRFAVPVSLTACATIGIRRAMSKISFIRTGTITP